MYKPKVERPLVYVAGPYSYPDPVANTSRAIGVGMRLWETGKCGVIVPHMMLLAHMVTPKPWGYWYAWGVDQLLRCQALYRMVGESQGADNEVIICRENSIPVFYEENWEALLLYCDQMLKGTESVYGY